MSVFFWGEGGAFLAWFSSKTTRDAGGRLASFQLALPFAPVCSDSNFSQLISRLLAQSIPGCLPAVVLNYSLILVQLPAYLLTSPKRRARVLWALAFFWAFQAPSGRARNVHPGFMHPWLILIGSLLVGLGPLLEGTPP